MKRALKMGLARPEKIVVFAAAALALNVIAIAMALLHGGPKSLWAALSCCLASAAIVCFALSMRIAKRVRRLDQLIENMSKPVHQRSPSN